MSPTKRVHHEVLSQSSCPRGKRRLCTFATKREKEVDFLHLGVNFFWHLLRYLQLRDVVQLGCTCRILSYIFLKNPVWLFFSQVSQRMLRFLSSQGGISCSISTNTFCSLVCAGAVLSVSPCCVRRVQL